MAQKKLISVLLVMLMLFGGTAASAAPPGVNISHGYLQVLPEYDQNNVIVNFAGNFINSSNLDATAELQFYIPKEAHMHLVGETKNGIASVSYETAEIPGEEYQLIKWKPLEPINSGENYPVLIEYCYTPFIEAGAREIPVNFKAPGNVESLTVEVKQPLRSSDFRMDPAPQKQEQDIEGFTVHVLEQTNLSSQEELKLTINYTKTDNEPSIQVNAGAPVQAADSGQSGQGNNTLIALFIGFLLVLGAVLAFAIKNNSKQTPVKAKHSKQRKVAYPKAVEARNKVPQGTTQEFSSHEGQAEERRKLRKLLVDGKITEQTYNQLLKELES